MGANLNTDTHNFILTSIKICKNVFGVSVLPLIKFGKVSYSSGYVLDYKHCIKLSSLLSVLSRSHFHGRDKNYLKVTLAYEHANTWSEE